MALTHKMRLFALEYLVDRNGTRAATAAGYGKKSAHVTASRLLRDPKIAEFIAPFIAKLDDAEKQREELAAATAKGVRRGIAQVASADARELVEVRRSCCRYCHGVNHYYQETPAQRARRWEEHQILLAKTPEHLWAKLPPFDEKGGVGYDKHADPDPDCPECFGDGEAEIFLHDTRKLSENGVAIYAGAKVTRDGMQIVLHDRLKALELSGRMHQLFGSEPGDGGEEDSRETVSNTFVAVYVANANINPKGDE